MPDTSDQLLAQLSRRVQCFLSATGISQRRLAKLIKTDETHLANFLAGRTGLSAEKSLRLMQILNASRSQLEAKLGKAASAQITHFQQSGRPMRLSNDGWVAGVGPDPNDGDITDVSSVNGEPSDDELTDVLRQVGNLHRQALQILNDYAGRTQRPKPNPNGTTEPARRIDDNTRSQTPGPKPAQISRR